jgi:hypothetical protein
VDNFPVIQVVTPLHRQLPLEAVRKLRDGLATCKTSRALSPEARVSIASLCNIAHTGDWSMEQLLIAIKDACYQSEEISRLTSTSERDSLVAIVVTACIQEYYSPRRAD